MEKNKKGLESILPAHVIADLCGVHERTARRWLAGESQCPAAARRLIDRTERGRMLPEHWPQHWRIQPNGLIEIGHGQCLSWQQIDWYFYSVNAWYKLLELIPRIEARLDALAKVAPRAEVIHLQRYRDELKALKERPFAMPADFMKRYELEPRQLHRQSGC